MAANPVINQDGSVAFNELSFGQFVEGTNPSVGAIRISPPGLTDVYVYEVHLSGAIADGLPDSAQHQRMEGSLLVDMAKRLGLNHEHFRDMQAVAGIVGMRNAWREGVLSMSRGPDWQHRPVLSEEVINDWERLTDNVFLEHPAIQGMLAKHREKIALLAPALRQASVITGQPVVDRGPAEVNVGKVVSQNSTYTAQHVQGGVVFHENSALAKLPRVGEPATITYYHGKGQVFVPAPEIQLSAPYMHPEKDTLAINYTNTAKNETHTLLFASVSGFATFAAEHGLDAQDVGKAVSLMEGKLLRMKEEQKREPVGMPFIDGESGAIALEYTERGNTFRALFDTRERFEALAADFGVGADHPARLKPEHVPEPLTETPGPKGMREALNTSYADAARIGQDALGKDGAVTIPNLSGGIYTGKVLGASRFHVVQDLGGKEFVVHSVFNLDKVPKVGQMMKVEYKGTRGIVAARATQNQGQAR